MKFTLISVVLALFASATMASIAPDLKRVVVSFANEAPAHVVTEAMDAIKKAGGVIIHEYNIIKGFAADAPVVALQQVQTMSTQFPAVIEEDQEMHTNNNGAA